MQDPQRYQLRKGLLRAGANTHSLPFKAGMAEVTDQGMKFCRTHDRCRILSDKATPQTDVREAEYSDSIGYSCPVPTEPGLYDIEGFVQIRRSDGKKTLMIKIDRCVPHTEGAAREIPVTAPSEPQHQELVAT